MDFFKTPEMSVFRCIYNNGQGGKIGCVQSRCGMTLDASNHGSHEALTLNN